MSSASFKAGEPSMEDILASIRRIISDDQEAIRAPEPEETACSPLKAVLDIAERHAAPVHSSPILFSEPLPQEEDEREAPCPDDIVRNVISNIVGVYGKDQPAPETPPTIRPAARLAPEPEGDEPLLSSQAGASVTEAFGRLNAIMLPKEPRSVEDLMKEMLRPMLKAWLDDNLPAMVERLVQAEIRRVTRG
jgi:cell pole-organizing protein PopZ